jgi:hypothetical protein
MASTFDVALTDTPVFVDPTGRRVWLGRRLLVAAFVVASAFLIGLVAAIVAIGHPDECSVAVTLHSAATSAGAPASGCRP